MTSPRRLAARSMLVCACALAFGGAAAEAAKAPVAVGDYEAIPELEAGGKYTKGVFSVQKVAGKRSIVAKEDYDGIYYPDVGKCDSELLPLVADSVPINANARFNVRDRTVLDDLDVLVVWKGRWKNAKRIAGTITIKSGGCASTSDWTARKVG